jgi:hypothetical protein
MGKFWGDEYFVITLDECPYCHPSGTCHRVGWVLDGLDFYWTACTLRTHPCACALSARWSPRQHCALGAHPVRLVCVLRAVYPPDSLSPITALIGMEMGHPVQDGQPHQAPQPPCRTRNGRERGQVGIRTHTGPMSGNTTAPCPARFPVKNVSPLVIYSMGGGRGGWVGVWAGVGVGLGEPYLTRFWSG